MLNPESNILTSKNNYSHNYYTILSTTKENTSLHLLIQLRNIMKGGGLANSQVTL